MNIEVSLYKTRLDMFLVKRAGIYIYKYFMYLSLSGSTDRTALIPHRSVLLE